jgi:hypothetical protein
MITPDERAVLTHLERASTALTARAICRTNHFARATDANTLRVDVLTPLIAAGLVSERAGSGPSVKYLITAAGIDALAPPASDNTRLALPRGLPYPVSTYVPGPWPEQSQRGHHPGIRRRGDPT